MGKGDLSQEVTHLFSANGSLVFCKPEESVLLNLRYIWP